MICFLTDRLFNTSCDSIDVAESILLRTVTRTLAEQYGISLGEILHAELVTNCWFPWCFTCRSGKIPETGMYHTMLLAHSSYP